MEVYYSPEVNSMKYCWLGVFRKEYFRHKKKKCPTNLDKSGSKNKKHLGGHHTDCDPTGLGQYSSLG